MVPINIVYRGELRCLATHGPSAVELVTDAPKDNHGRGESFSPTDLVAAAFGTCMLTIMGIVSKRDGINLDGTRIEVEKHMTTVPPRRISRLVARFTMPVGIPVAARATLERAAHTCPVALSLHSDIVQDVTFVWP